MISIVNIFFYTHLLITSMKTHFFIPLLTTFLVLMPSISAGSQTPANSILFTPPPPPDVGEPSDRSQGGGTRSPRCEQYEGVTALVPMVQTGDRQVRWGITTRAHPIIWLSAPKGLVKGTPIEFVLRDDNDQIIERSVQSAVATVPGSVSFTTAIPLQIGKTYRWIASITCDTEIPDVPLRVEGYIQRAAQPETLTPPTDPFQQAAAYASKGIWYDALAVLGKQYRQDRSPAIAAAWLKLLQQVNLDQLPNTPIGSCCRVEPQNLPSP